MEEYMKYLQAASAASRVLTSAEEEASVKIDK